MSETRYTTGNLHASCTTPDTSCRCGFIFDEAQRTVAKAFYGEAGTNGMDPDITVDEMKANSARLAHCWNNYDQLEIDRNRWRSVAEQAEKAVIESQFLILNLKGTLEAVNIRDVEYERRISRLILFNKLAISAFDSLRKEETGE